MSATQDTRPIGITTPLGKDVLLLRGFVLREELGRPFVIDADLEMEISSMRGRVSWEKLLGHPVSIRMDWPRGRRFFHGYVCRFAQLPNRGRMARFKATIVPWLWMLTRNADCRIYQEKTVLDIVSDAFQRHGFTDFEAHLRENYLKKEYCVQYRESDFNFVNRSLEKEGIYYWFKQEETKHTLCLSDSISASSPVSGYESIPFSVVDRGTHEREVIFEWTAEQEIQPVGFALTDFDFKSPHASLLASSGIQRSHGQACYEMFDYPGDYTEQNDGDRLARIRIEEYESRYEVFRAQTTVRALHCGATFKLESHPIEDMRKEYLVTSQVMSIDTGGFEAQSEFGREDYSCSFTAIDAQQAYRPERSTHKPVIQGPQTALVVGPEDEEQAKRVSLAVLSASEDALVPPFRGFLDAVIRSEKGGAA